tara:strand:- start:361 stop:1131 length:771 start_codon:yes stop_codon:yes gene_type:complete
MSDSQIVLLGDCIATGQDLLWPEILGDEDFVADAIECAKNKVLEQKLVSWYLKNNKEKVDFNSIIHHSYKSKIKKEKDMSWVSHIPNSLNLAVAGETFQGMHKKIKKIILENSKPSMVLITCFSEGHRCVVINQNNQKFVVKRDINFLELDQHIWPTEIYQEFMTRLNDQELLGEQFQRRKNIKSFEMLTRLLDHHQIPYKFLLFRKYNSYISTQYVNLSDLPKKYRNDKGQESSNRKLEAQPEIARRVMNAVGLS